MIKIKNLCIMLIVSFVLLSLSSCDLYHVEIDENYDGLSIGFTYEDEHKIFDITCAVRSNQTEFDIDNVTLDCYYGWYTHTPIHYYQDSNFEPVCVALYFVYGYSNMLDEFHDYKNIDKMHFLKEISIEEFSTEAYNVKNSQKEGKTFEQHSALTIPKEIFVGSFGIISFVVVNIARNPQTNLFFVRGLGFRTIQYDFIDEETVRLYK
ncbi:MAG: hypothetical protein ACOX5E_05810 [Bacilli bacterium]|nr:hypothetical protein [Acholeplasmataceae bacterium]